MDKKVFFLAFFVVALYLVAPVVAAADASPGSTTSIAGFPVTQTFKGLTASTAYDVRCTSDGNSTIEFTSDSDGKASVTISPPDYGINTYVVCLDAGGADVLTFSIDNMDIMIYLLPMIGLMITFAIISAVLKAVKF